jgi:uncharacterized membrane protein
MKKNFFYYPIILLLLLPSHVAFAQTPSSDGSVRAVLFFSPTCGHCQLVISEVILPLLEQYGGRLNIAGVDISQPGGDVLFLAALQYFNLESAGVPFLVIEDTYLVGSADIPEIFPGLIEQYLAQGGVDWPAIPGLAEAMMAAEQTEASTPAGSTPTVESVETQAASLPVPSSPTTIPGLIMTGDRSGDLWATFNRDLEGNVLAVIILLLMVLSVGGAVLYLRRAPRGRPAAAVQSGWQVWLIPVLCVVGLCVAGYLAYVETSQVEAVCGPVGDCNTVQQSAYARLFGVVPIGILGVAGYLLILLAWGIQRMGNQQVVAYASLALLGLTSLGVLFSIYLTFLEPFVIGATCAWCLASALLMTTLFGLSLLPARQALAEQFPKGKRVHNRTKLKQPIS